MGGGHDDVRTGVKDPFKLPDDHKVPDAKTPTKMPEGAQSDGNPAVSYPEQWGTKQWWDIYYPSQNFKPSLISEVSEAYDDIARILDAGFHDMNVSMAKIVGTQWTGAGATAAQGVTEAYVANGNALKAAVDGMKINLENLSNSIDTTKSTLPTAEEVRKYVEDAMNNAIDDTGRDGKVAVSTNDGQGLSWKIDYDFSGWSEKGINNNGVTTAMLEPLFNSAQDSASENNRTVMTSHFDPGISASDTSIPVFLAPPPKPGDLTPPPGGPGGGNAGPNAGGGNAPPSFSGGGGGGLGEGGGTSGGAAPPPSAADVAAQTRQLLETGDSGGNPAGPMPTGVDPMQGGANAPGGSGAMPMPGSLGGVPGMSGASGASDAVKKAMSQGAALAGIPSPAGLGGLQSKLGGLGKPGEMPAGLKGLSGLPHGAGGAGAGGGGAGAGGGGGGTGAGGGGGGPLGAPKAMSDAATREASISQGLRESAAAERGAATAARAGTSAAPAGGGAPMGGGGARGGGGEDKEHKANKFLRSTRRGEDLLGQAPPATAAVIAPQ